MPPTLRHFDTDYVSVPLLGYQDYPKEDAQFEDTQKRAVYHPKTTRCISIMNLIAIISMFLNLAFTFLYVASRFSVLPSLGPRQKWVSMPQLSSPADDVVEYTLTKFTRGDEDDIPLYDQAPSQEVDDAWYDLYKGKHPQLKGLPSTIFC
jgi:hypothetical protein